MDHFAKHLALRNKGDGQCHTLIIFYTSENYQRRKFDGIFKKSENQSWFVNQWSFLKTEDLVLIWQQIELNQTGIRLIIRYKPELDLTTQYEP